MQHELWAAERKQTLYQKLKNRLTPLNSPIIQQALAARDDIGVIYFPPLSP